MESQKKGSGCSRDDSQGMLSSLIARLLRTAQEDNPAEVKVPPDVGTGRLPVVPFPEASAQSVTDLGVRNTMRMTFNMVYSAPRALESAS